MEIDYDIICTAVAHSTIKNGYLLIISPIHFQNLIRIVCVNTMPLNKSICTVIVLRNWLCEIGDLVTQTEVHIYGRRYTLNNLHPSIISNHFNIKNYFRYLFVMMVMP